METKDAYKQKLEAQLKEWSAQINLFAAKMENAGADVKLKYAQELDVLHAKQREAAKRSKSWRMQVAIPGKGQSDRRYGLG